MKESGQQKTVNQQHECALKYTEEFDNVGVGVSTHDYKWLPNICLNNNTYYNKKGLIEYYKQQILKLPYKIIMSDKMLNDMAEAIVNKYGTKFVNKNLNSIQRGKYRHGKGWTDRYKFE